MPYVTLLKQFRIYLKSQVGHGWSVEGRKSKGRLLTRVSLKYLTGKRSVVLLDINFDAENQNSIVRTIEKLSDLMRKRNIDLDYISDSIGNRERTFLDSHPTSSTKSRIIAFAQAA